MKRHLKKSYFLLQSLIGRESRLLDDIRRGNFITVLNLHQVSPHQNPFWAPLHPDIFDDLLGFVNERFEVLSFGELNKPKTDKPKLVLSFDDGYRNFVEFAVPILDRHGLRANMNIIPSCVESGRPMWNIRLYDFLNSAPIAAINDLTLRGFDQRLTRDDYDSKLRFGLAISRFLKNRPRKERDELWLEASAFIDGFEFPETKMMSRTDIRAIAVRHEIGVHSFSHESMAFEDEEFFRADLEKCVGYFRDQLELPLKIYAFPNGSYRESQVTLLRKAGIEHILLVGEDFARAGTDVFPRFTIYGSSNIETRFQALGFNRKKL